VAVVPTVDLMGDAHTVAGAIDAACREVGFFQIVGHGVDAELESRAWGLAGAFFGLPIADRVAVTIREGEAYGYGSFASERLAASLGADGPPDLKETFSIGPSSDGRVPLGDPAAEFVFSPTPWPASLPDMEAIMRRYYATLADLARRVMSLMAIGLGLDVTTFDSSIDRHTSALRLLRYPPTGPDSTPPGQMRAGAHTDYGTLTLLRQDGAPGGLQVRDLDGEWHDVPAIEGAYVVNVGDALERWTNDRWRSTLHRVVLPAPSDPAADRRSIAFFHNANWDAVIECLPGCVEPGAEPRYPPVAAGRHLMDKFRSTQ
jgi:isopenicillin N synthase-like dioxygenase